jgi:hypothetical protein
LKQTDKPPISAQPFANGRAKRFARDGVAGEEAPDGVVTNRYAFVGERLSQFLDRDVGRFFG